MHACYLPSQVRTQTQRKVRQAQRIKVEEPYRIMVQNELAQHGKALPKLGLNQERSRLLLTFEGMVQLAAASDLASRKLVVTSAPAVEGSVVQVDAAANSSAAATGAVACDTSAMSDMAAGVAVSAEAGAAAGDGIAGGGAAGGGAGGGADTGAGAGAGDKTTAGAAGGTGDVAVTSAAAAGIAVVASELGEESQTAAGNPTERMLQQLRWLQTAEPLPRDAWCIQWK
jgi:hypothetical protein